MNTVFWLPYFQLMEKKDVPCNEGTQIGKSVRVEELELGNAIVLPDTEEVWKKRIGCDRPRYLKMYCEEAWNSSEDSPPAIGTVIISDDDDWLIEFADRIVSILYFLCDSNATPRPAELFKYHRLNTKTKDGTFTVLHNKFGWSGEGVFEESGESVRSLSIYPPSALRGVQRECHVDFSMPHSSKLIDHFKADPTDRLFIAIRQYFRAQFADLFSSTFESDYACYCASLEAALKLPEGEQTGDEFEKQLVAYYSAKKLMPSDDQLRKLFKGWFCARSVYVHGGSGGKSKKVGRQQAYEYFQSLRFKTSITRQICRESVLRVIDDANEHDVADLTIDLVLSSTDTWTPLKKKLTGRCAAKKINLLSDFSEFESIANDWNNKFDWACVSPSPNPKIIYSMLVTCAIVLGHLTDSKSSVYALSNSLGKAAAAKDSEAIRKWLSEAISWKRHASNDPIGLFKFLAWRVAQYFREFPDS